LLLLPKRFINTARKILRFCLKDSLLPSERLIASARKICCFSYEDLEILPERFAALSGRFIDSASYNFRFRIEDLNFVCK